MNQRWVWVVEVCGSSNRAWVPVRTWIVRNLARADAFNLRSDYARTRVVKYIPQLPRLLRGVRIGL